MNEMSTCELLFKILKDQPARNVMGLALLFYNMYLCWRWFYCECQDLKRCNKCCEPWNIIAWIMILWFWTFSHFISYFPCLHYVFLFFSGSIDTSRLHQWLSLEFASMKEINKPVEANKTIFVVCRVLDLL